MSEITENKIKHKVEITVSKESFMEYIKTQGLKVEGKLEKIYLNFGSYDTDVKIEIQSVKEDRLKEIEYDGKSI